MRKIVFIFAGLVLMGIVVHQIVFHVAHADVRAIAQQPYPELEWLRQEFQIGEVEWETIRELHLKHDEKCLAYCAELEASNQELLELMRENREVGPELEVALKRATELRERCRRTTLKHIYAVSEQMPPEAGVRYVEMMTSHLIDEVWHEHLTPGDDEATHPHGKHP